MRPKRRILLIDPHPERRSITRFVLQNGRYRVSAAESLEQAVELWSDIFWDMDLIIGYWPIDEARLVDLAQSQTRLPVMFVASQHATPQHLGNATLIDTVSMEELLQRIGLLVQRKRGPRQGFKRIPVQSVATPHLEAVNA